MALSEQPEAQTGVRNLQEVAEQAVRGLKALDNLAQVAMPDRNAQLEAQRQVGLVAQALLGLARRYQEVNFDKAATWLDQNLLEMAAQLDLEPLVVADPAAEMSEAEAERRLSLTLPVAQPGQDKNGVISSSKRRVIIASLEQVDSALPLIVTAAHSFDRERWTVTNLGYHVPIMALTSTVQDVRPSVLVLIVARGQLIAESARLVEDLKKTFFGLKVIAIGPPFATQSVLGERLGADLYDSAAEKTAEMAEHALHPLNRISEPLALLIETELEKPGKEPKTQELSPFSEDMPTLKTITLVEETRKVEPEVSEPASKKAEVE